MNWLDEFSCYREGKTKESANRGVPSKAEVKIFYFNP